LAIAVIRSSSFFSIWPKFWRTRLPARVQKVSAM
jgi:hypothetical protein